MAGLAQSRLAAKLQEYVSLRREKVGLYREIAAQLPPLDAGRLLDVGTGTGLQLRAIHAAWPEAELYGLDLSAAAIRLARRHLRDLGVHLRVGSIAQAPYEGDFFDVVTCHSSMSYWDDPVSCFDEIYRILKTGGQAALFEPQKDIDLDEVVATIDRNLAGTSPLRRFVARNVNRLALSRGRTVGLRLRSDAELSELARQSRFGESHQIERTALQNLPIFARITLLKPGGEGHDQ